MTNNTARAAMTKARKLVAAMGDVPDRVKIAAALAAACKARDAADDMEYRVGGIWAANSIEARALKASCEQAEDALAARRGAGINHPKRYVFDGGESVAFRRSLGIAP